MRVGDVFPLRDIKLANVTFLGPADPGAVLLRHYGRDWRTPDRLGTGAWSSDDIHSTTAAALRPSEQRAMQGELMQGY